MKNGNDEIIELLKSIDFKLKNILVLIKSSRIKNIANKGDKK